MSNDFYNDQNNSEQKTNNRALLVLFFAVFIDLLGFGLIIPILPFWVTTQLGQSDFVYGLLAAVYSIAQFLFAPLWGRASDKFGRRPVIMVGLTGTIIGFGLLSIAAFVQNDLLLIFIARGISGMFTAATLPTSQAYISDSTSGADRAKGFGLIGAAFGLGFAFGPAIGGVLFLFGKSLDGTGYLAPCLFALFLAILNILLAFRNIPETLTKEMREKNIHIEIGTEFRKEENTIITIVKSPTILLIVSMFTILSLSFSSMESTIALFGKARFGMEEAGTAGVLLLVGFVSIITQGGLIRPLSKRFEDSKLVATGLAILTFAFVGLLTVYSYASILFWGIFLALGSSIAQPTIGALLSKSVPKNKQGAILGFNSGMGSLMRIFGPIIGTGLLILDSGYPYIFSSILLGFCVILSIYIIKETRGQSIGFISCHNCGGLLSQGIAKCSNCGARVDSV
ncbi:MAG: MFS transporter [Candidatus Thorarchaeota archaeon]